MNTHDPTITVPDQAQRALDTLLVQRTRQPFVWGLHDCCLFAADAVAAMTGRDHAAGMRGTYHTEEQAAVVLQQLGGLEACGARAGPPCPPLTARAGDIGLVFDGRRELLGVCVGAHWKVPAKHGLTDLPLRAARLAWRLERG